MTTKLPAYWVHALLSDIVTINPPNPDVVVSDDTIVSFVPMALVEEMSGRLDGTTTRVWRDVKKGYTKFQDGDLVWAKITPSMENGKAALAAGLASGIGAGTTEFHVLRPRVEIEPRYLLHYILQESVRKRARSRMTGTAGQLRVPTLFLEEERLPVPPAPEQKRIAEAIDLHLSRLDAAVLALEKAQKKLRVYRSSLVKSAVEGRLVTTECELAQRDGRPYESADALLERILKERRRRWEEGQLAKMEAAGKTPKDDKWKTKYEVPRPPDVTRLPELPQGWCWARLDQISDLQLGQQRSPLHAAAEKQIPYVRAANITWDGLDLTDVKEMGFPNPARYRLRDGDVLLSEASGSPMEAGKPAIWRDEIPGACYQKTLIRVRALDQLALLPEYLRLVFLRDCVTGKFARLAPGVGIVHLTAERMLPWPIPIAPVSEQRRIVDEVDRLESLQKVIGGSASQETIRVRRLRQAVLRWAFEGKLVDQNPADEPAEQLLARIRAERSSGGTDPKNRYRRAKGAA